MRAPVPNADAGLIAAQYEAAAGVARLRELKESFAAADPATVQAILDEAVRYAEEHLAGFGEGADRIGATLVDGRVRTAPGHKEAWKAFVAGGWPTLDIPHEEGGQGLPAALAFAVQEICDRHCAAFGMVPVPTRSAARLIAAYGSDAMHDQWMPMLASGEWTATIVISEVEAGSDVMRMRTLATREEDDSWSITGEKQWISFGDHDVAPRIGHCVLARTRDQNGLSLFLVPDTLTGDRRNGVVVRRIEEKLGLHASPTCALGFEAAKGWLIGEEGRGLQQMFTMITNMRLATGAGGLGIAAGAADVALAYAAERRQGGRDAKPVAIDRHIDVQRMLLDMVAKVEMLRGLVLATANQADLAAYETDAEAKADAAALAGWLLPIVKTTGGDYGFEVASEAVQVLGGAGYTREWPVEQGMRDARVMTIFEGTTGIQALDLVHRRIRKGDGRGLRRFLALARADGGDALAPTLDLLEDAAGKVGAGTDVAAIEGGATAMLRLAQLAAAGWIAARLAALDGEDAAVSRLRTAGRHWLAGLTAKATLAHAEALAGDGIAERFAALKGSPSAVA